VTFHTDPSPFMWGWQRWVFGGSVVAFPGAASLFAVAQPATANTSADSTHLLRIRFAITTGASSARAYGKAISGQGNTT
jgi:hypothetical protein